MEVGSNHLNNSTIATTGSCLQQAMVLILKVALWIGHWRRQDNYLGKSYGMSSLYRAVEFGVMLCYVCRSSTPPSHTLAHIMIRATVTSLLIQT